MMDGEIPHGPHRLDIALGSNIRRRRKGLGLSQTALAQSVGLTFQQIQKYERGFNRVSFSRLVAIAHALNCRVIDLIEDLDDEAPAQPDEIVAGSRALGGSDILNVYTHASVPVQRAVLELLTALHRSKHA
jgi:transcriptional regulator with XRE-family HTH domain